MSQISFDYNNGISVELGDVFSGILENVQSNQLLSQRFNFVGARTIQMSQHGVQDKQNIAAAFRISEAFGVKKLTLLDSGYDEDGMLLYIDSIVIREIRDPVIVIRSGC